MAVLKVAIKPNNDKSTGQKVTFMLAKDGMTHSLKMTGEKREQVCEREREQRKRTKLQLRECLEVLSLLGIYPGHLSEGAGPMLLSYHVK